MFFNSFIKLQPSRRQSAAPGSFGNQASPGPGRPGAERQSPWFYGVILLICLGAVAWALLSQRYYAWSLSNERINLVIFCDTADLNDPDLKAMVLYDQMALNPLIRALGLYQNRPPQSVSIFFPLPIRKFAITPFSITLQDVPWGPISRIVFVARGRHFNVTVTDRRLINGAIYVRIPS